MIKIKVNIDSQNIISLRVLMWLDALSPSRQYYLLLILLDQLLFCLFELIVFLF